MSNPMIQGVRVRGRKIAARRLAKSAEEVAQSAYTNETLTRERVKQLEEWRAEFLGRYEQLVVVVGTKADTEATFDTIGRVVFDVAGLKAIGARGFFGRLRWLLTGR